MLTPDDRERVVAALMLLRRQYSKLKMPESVIEVYRRPPASPDDCIFAKTTTCISADFEHAIAPCQFGGTPDCANCGCMASAGLAAVGRHRLGGMIPIDALVNSSFRIGDRVSALRSA
jgi:hypothetical protein